jgi:8-oxo-dGTP pyrophosphatase MutT (NUDIX family)
MSQKYKVFINDLALHFLEEMHSCDLREGAAVFNKPCPKVFFRIIESMFQGDVTEVFVLGNREMNWENFLTNVVPIEAAGGIVLNEFGETLWIYRNGRWDLPKGKLDKGEKADEAAVREVEEECGVSGLVLGDLRDQTYHVYRQNGDYYLKRTSWFEMFVPGRPETIPQKEEGIDLCEWCNGEKQYEKVGNTYTTISSLFQEETA